MSTHTIYIEVSDEITTVIERLKNAPEDAVALIVPKGAILLQSVINLKLAKKAAADSGKQIVLVSTDKIGRNLATQLGIPVVANEKDAGLALEGKMPASETAAAEDGANVIDGVRIHRYYDEQDDGEAAPAAGAAPVPDPIIIPKNIMQEPPAAAKASPIEPIEVPTTPPVTDGPLQRTKIDTEPNPVTPPPVVTTTKVTTPPVGPATGKGDAAPLPKKRKLFYFGVFLLVLILLAATAVSFLFLPVTTATLAVPAESWTRDLEFTASSAATAVSDDNLTIPADTVVGEAEGKLTFKSTGVKKVGTNATGTATLYNYTSTSPQTLPAGSTISAASRTFVTQAAVTVPGYSQSVGGPRTPGEKTVAINASEVGPESNLTDATAADITGPGINLSGKVTATGGTSTDVAIVSATDITNAKNALTLQLKDAARVKLEEQMQNRDPRYDEKADSFALADFTVTAASGAEAESAEASAKGQLKRLVVNYAQLKGVSETRILADQEPNKKTLIESVEVASFVVSPDNKQVAIKAVVSGKVSQLIPTAELQSRLTSRSEADGRKIASELVPNSTLSATYKPGWWPIKRFPYFGKFLRLHITYE